MGMAEAGWKMRDGCRACAKNCSCSGGVRSAGLSQRRRWGHRRYSEFSGLLTDHRWPQGVALWQLHDAIF